jgi:hypothetical protein
MPNWEEFDFTEALKNRGVVPDGEYLAQVASISKETSNAGNPMWVVDVEIIEPEQYMGAQLRDWMALTPAAAWKVIDFLEALGVEVVSGDITKLDLDILVGLQVRIETAQNTGEEKKKFGKRSKPTSYSSVA